jgi:hypothetical protein
LTTTANNETNPIARTGCCALQADTRPAHTILGAWNSGLDAGLNAWDWYNFIKHQFFRGKTLILCFVRVKTNLANIFYGHKPKRGLGNNENLHRLEH